MQKRVSDEEYKLVLLEIADTIDRFCRSRGLKYYMIGGTALGAIRHKGFIPWDDDIDLGMPRRDYEVFCTEFNKENSRYKVICVQNDPSYYLPSGKVIDTAISLTEDINTAGEIGAYVDLFPLDYVEKDKKGKCGFFENHIEFQLQELKYLKVKRQRRAAKNCVIVLGHLLYPFSLNTISKKRELRAKKYSVGTDKGWIANLHGAWGEKEVIRSKIFGDGADYQFENLVLRGPVDCDGYLSAMYGDYMQLPPVEKRVTHHGFDAYWK